jgi:hypothetical protein
MGSDGHASDGPVHSRNLASDLEVLDGLLNTFTDVLDIREVFERVSQLVQPVLPHDIMGVVEINESGDRLKLYAGTGLSENTPPFETPVRDREMLMNWKAIVIDDVQTNIFSGEVRR